MTFLIFPVHPAQASVSAFNLISSTGTAGTGVGTLRSPRGIAVDGSGNVFVVEYSNNRIQKFTSSLVYNTAKGGTSCSTSNFCSPTDVAVDSLGYVYVTDWSNHRVRKLSNDLTTVVWTKGGTSSGSGNDQFNYPTSIAIDSSGYVYVADSNNYRVKKMDADGNYVASWGSNGTGDGQFSNMSGIAIDPDGNVWVLDMTLRKFSKFSNTGTFISSFTKTSGDSTTTNTLNGPTEFAFDASGDMYVTDQYNSRIVKFSNTGTYISQYGGLTSPYGITISGGVIYSTDSSNSTPKIRKFDYSGTAYQVSNVNPTLDVVVQSNSINIESSGIYGISTATPVRLKTSGGKVLSDFTLTLSADTDWTGVNGDSDYTTSKTYVTNLMGTSGISATHSLYVPIPNGRTSTAVRICPDATSLADVSLTCTNGVSRAAGSYTESFGNITVSQVSNLGDSISYWKIDGMTGSGGQADGLVSYSGAGSGTQPDPYLITSCLQLQEMKDNRAAYWQIAGNIDCNATSTWNSGDGFVPVGSSSQPFTGSLIGNGTYAIDGLYISIGARNEIGLLGYTSQATISNVLLTDIYYVKGNNATSRIGGLIGEMSGGTLDHISVSGIIEQTANDFNDTSEVGGIVGLISGGTNDLSYLTSNVTISLREQAYQVGGIVGETRGVTTISESVAQSAITVGHTSQNVGGFVGWMVGNTTISNSHATGTVIAGIDTANTPSSNFDIAGFVGAMGNSNTYTGNTSITNCYATGNVTSGVRDAGSGYLTIYDVAGFVGLMEANSSISDSYATGAVTVDLISIHQGYSGVGGFVALQRKQKTGSAPTITNSYATGAINAPVGNSGDNVGGFVGTISAGTISNSHATGNITISPSYEPGNDNGNSIGGFAGLIGNSTVTTSYASGSINTDGDVFYVGGFVGSISANNSGSITQAYSLGNVEGYDWVGGFVGDTNGPAGFSVSDSFSRGNVYAYTTYPDGYAGGFMGTLGGITVQNVYSTGSVTLLTPPGDFGGLVGSTGNTATSSYWDKDTSGVLTSGTGLGLTTAEMKDPSNFVGWDFGTIWSINALLNDGYPQLRFDDISSPSPSPSPTSTPTPTPSSSPENSSPSSAPSPRDLTAAPNLHCTDLGPLVSPIIFNALRTHTESTTDSVTLSFTPTNDRTTGYTVYYGTHAGDAHYSVSFNQSPSPGALRYTISQLNPSQPYTFWMNAYNECLPGPASAPVTVGSQKGTPQLQIAAVSEPSPTPLPPPPSKAVPTNITFVSSQGTPLVGARITITQPHSSPVARNDVLYSATLSEILGAETDDQGRVSVTLYPGPYTVRVDANGTFSTDDITIDPSHPDIQVVVDTVSFFDRISVMVQKVTDLAIKTIVVTGIIAFSIRMISTLILAFSTLFPLYSHIARPLIKMPWDIATALWQQFTYLVSATASYFFGVKSRRTRGTGSVFDSITNHPLAGVYLVFYSDSGNLTSTFSNIDGSYSVTPVPDQYNLRAHKSAYIFPSRLVTGGSSLLHTEIYIPNTTYIVDSTHTSISRISIPLDPLGVGLPYPQLFSKIITSLRYLLTLPLSVAALYVFTVTRSSLYLFVSLFLGISILSRTLYSTKPITKT